VETLKRNGRKNMFIGILSGVLDGFAFGIIGTI
jgi:hypothetical protein